MKLIQTKWLYSDHANLIFFVFPHNPIAYESLFRANTKKVTIILASLPRHQFDTFIVGNGQIRVMVTSNWIKSIDES